MRTLTRDFRTLFTAGSLGALTDGQLLDRFLAQNDDLAFEELVRRHGPMVWGVCRRTLRLHHDAEDAFQATFLVLARKGGTVSPREKLPNWLYGVAVQTALKARALAARRTDREKQVAELPEPIDHRLERVANPRHGLDLDFDLDRELVRLPEKYRIPIVLCDLEGESQRSAASRLGWPIGTLSGRLSRARAMLASRLNRQRQHHLSPPRLTARALTLVLAGEAKSAAPALPAGLMAATVRLSVALGDASAEQLTAPVSALADHVLTAMALSRFKTFTAGLLSTGLIGLGLTLGAAAEQAGTLENQANKPAPDKPQATETAAPTSIKADLDRLQGTWFGTVVESGNDKMAIPPQIRLIVRGDRVFLRGPRFARTVSFGTLEETELTLKLDRSGKQNLINLTCLGLPESEPMIYRGIYTLTDQFQLAPPRNVGAPPRTSRTLRLQMTLSLPGQDRPREPDTSPRPPQIWLELRQPILDDAPRTLPETFPRVR